MGPKILEQSQRSKEIYYHPTAAYVSMPKTNKHIAFDPRLFHGSSSPMSKGKGGLRIAIGTNYHTARVAEANHYPFLASIATSPVDLNDVEDGSIDDLTIHKPRVTPWDVKSNVVIPSRDDWTFFDLETAQNGRFYLCSDPYRFIRISLRMPISLIMNYDAERSPGATLGIKLSEGDYLVRFDKYEFREPNPRNSDTEARELADDFLRKRCEIFPHDDLSMNPPLNVRLCQHI